MARLDVSKISPTRDRRRQLLSTYKDVSFAVLLASPFVTLVFWLVGVSDYFFKGLLVGFMSWWVLSSTEN